MRTNIIKHTIAYFGLICAAGLLSSCASDSKEGLDSKDLQIETRIASARESRAIDATNYEKKQFVEADEIGINQGADIDKDAAKTYLRSASKWVTKTTDDRLTVSGAEGEKFTAFYPLSHTSILEDQTTPENFWVSNLLAAKGAVPLGNLVTFNFVPAYCKVTVNITYAEAQTTTGSTIFGSGLIASGVDATIKLYRTSQDVSAVKHSYVGIFQPSELGLKVTVVGSAGGTQSYTHTSKVFKPANNYIFNFTSTNELILNGVTVSPFTSSTEVDAGNAM